jgi:hypothetical protein
MTPREEAQLEAERTYVDFLQWSKRILYCTIASLLLVASCNFGVRDKKYPNYNGEVYAPKNLGVSDER